MWELFSGELLRRDIRQLTCTARLLDLFRMAPSVHTHLHKAQRHVEPRYSRSHSWHNKSRAGSMFAWSPRHIPFAGDISQWLRDFFSGWVPALSSKFLFALEGNFCLLSFPFLSCHVQEISSWLSLAMFAAESDLMSPTWFNPCKYRQQIHNLMIHIMKTGYKLSTGSARLVLFTSSGAESL